MAGLLQEALARPTHIAKDGKAKWGRGGGACVGNTHGGRAAFKAVGMTKTSDACWRYGKARPAIHGLPSF